MEPPEGASAEAYDKPWPEVEDLPTPKFIEVSENPEQAAIEILRGALPDAAQTIADIAAGRLVANSSILGNRLKAAMAVAERVLGKVKEGSGDGWEDFLNRINQDVKR